MQTTRIMSLEFALVHCIRVGHKRVTYIKQCLRGVAEQLTPAAVSSLMVYHAGLDMFCVACFFWQCCLSDAT